jgi:hypothetical protein
MPGRQEPDAGGELGRDIDHALTVAQQPLREGAPQAARVLDSPLPLGPTASPLAERPVASAGAGDPHLADDPELGIQGGRRVAPLVRVDADRELRGRGLGPLLLCHALLLEMVPRRTARLRAEQASLESLLERVPDGPQAS